MKRFVGLTLAFLLLFNLFGCQWLIPEDGTPDTNDSQGSVDQDETQLPEEENHTTTFEVEDRLKFELLTYVSYYYGGFDETISRTLEGIINLSRSDYAPLLIELSETDCYYVCIYYTDSHEYPEEEHYCHCCWENYTWVGFKSREMITEEYNGEKLLDAFQINRQTSCKNLKTDECDSTVEHYMIYEPVFENGVNIAPIASLNKHLFYLTDTDDNPIYFTSTTNSYQDTNLHCIEIDGEMYFRENESIFFETGTGDCSERDLTVHYGEYYDELIGLMITDKYSETVENKDGTTTTYNYALFKVSDIAKLMKRDIEQ